MLQDCEQHCQRVTMKAPLFSDNKGRKGPPTGCCGSTPPSSLARPLIHLNTDLNGLAELLFHSDLNTQTERCKTVWRLPIQGLSILVRCAYSPNEVSSKQFWDVRKAWAGSPAQPSSWPPAAAGRL